MQTLFLCVLLLFASTTFALFQQGEPLKIENYGTPTGFSFVYKQYYFVSARTQLFNCSTFQMDTTTVPLTIVRTFDLCLTRGIVSNQFAYALHEPYTRDSSPKMLIRWNLETFDMQQAVTAESAETGEVIRDTDTFFAHNGNFYFSSIAARINSTIYLKTGRLNATWQYEKVSDSAMLAPSVDATGQHVIYYAPNSFGNFTVYKTRLLDWQVVGSFELSNIIYVPGKLNFVDQRTAVALCMANKYVTLSIGVVDMKLVAVNNLPSGVQVGTVGFGTNSLFLVTQAQISQLSLNTLQIISTLKPAVRGSPNSVSVAANGASFYVASYAQGEAYFTSYDTRCNMGEYLSVTTGACINCPNGTITTSYNALQCDACALGTYANVSNCTQCAPGYYSNVTLATSCLSCPIRTFVATKGALSCLPCATANTTASTFCKTVPPPIRPYDPTVVIIASILGGGAILIGVVGVAVFAIIYMVQKRKQQNLDSQYHNMKNLTDS